ncbi:MAG: 3'-5' exonuclease domain-containing protein 2 [Prolixibacteraceae bacterium]|jgi:ribonuclease D|nr:3'-5' exonuclease domain-containing protein 2 [Prolixibacteraceae bacterium]MDD4754937.1 3'-5' exonuclease domain-containing protein 2 [Prolixibacteraceae bacterium]
MIYKESITKEELADMPLRWFEGEIIVVEHSRQVKSAAEFLSEFPVLGFDTETKPSFQKGNLNKVALLQLSASSHAFLFRINRLGLPSEIKKILSSAKIVKPGVAIRDDIKGLQQMKRFNPDGFIELQNYAKEFGIKNFSLKKLAAIVLGFRISKSQQLSNWESHELSDAQKIYAATDAWVALKIYESFFKTSNNV